MSTYVDANELRVLGGSFQGAALVAEFDAEDAIYRGAARIEGRAKVLAPVDTGALEGSISSDVNGLSAEVGPTVDYGGFVELGTEGPYVIRAKDGGKLAFTVGGRKVFVDEVVHPGNAPQPYLGPAFDASLPSIIDDLADVGGL